MFLKGLGDAGRDVESEVDVVLALADEELLGNTLSTARNLAPRVVVDQVLTDVESGVDRVQIFDAALQIRDSRLGLRDGSPRY